MNIELELYGSLRNLEPGDRLQLPVTGAKVADLRSALVAHAEARWPRVSPLLLQRCAFATRTAVLRDHQALPPDGHMVILPPVSGG